ncbi:Uncharacterised protein [Mycobacterium tuberculosis]|nr:Uncharacterised protein [Mycobacterium tuberculosis]
MVKQPLGLIQKPSLKHQIHSVVDTLIKLTTFIIQADNQRFIQGLLIFQILTKMGNF